MACDVHRDGPNHVRQVVVCNRLCERIKHQVDLNSQMTSVAVAGGFNADVDSYAMRVTWNSRMGTT